MEELGLFLGLGDDANYQLANPSLLAYYKELNERRLWLDCEVDDEAIGDMCRQIIRWNKAQRRNKSEYYSDSWYYDEPHS